VEGPGALDHDGVFEHDVAAGGVVVAPAVGLVEQPPAGDQRAGSGGVRWWAESAPAQAGADDLRLVSVARATLPMSRPALATTTPSGDQMRDCAAASS
jgi:hypothetical protein